MGEPGMAVDVLYLHGGEGDGEKRESGDQEEFDEGNRRS